jgi:hypothetical protein
MTRDSLEIYLFPIWSLAIYYFLVALISTMVDLLWHCNAKTLIIKKILYLIFMIEFLFVIILLFEHPFPLDKPALENGTR